MAWTKPASTSLSCNDISNIIAGLRGPHREEVLAFLDTVEDHGLLYVVACELIYGRATTSQPAIDVDADGYRGFIRAASELMA